MPQTSQRSLAAVVVAGLVSSFAASICSATTLYWDGTSTVWAGSASAWSTSSSATTPNPSALPSASDVAVFNISSVNSAQSIDLNSNVSVLGLVFNSSGPVSIRAFPSLSNNLTVNASGITINPGAGPVTINTNNLSVNVNQTWTNNSANAFTVNGWVDLSNGTLANLGRTLTLDGSGDFLFTGAVYAGSTLVKNGAGTLRLTGDDDNIGLTLVANSGTVILDKASVANSGLFTEVHAVGSALTVGGALVQLAGTGGDQIYGSDTVDIQSGTFDMNGRNEDFDTLKLAGTGLGGAGALINSAAGTTSSLTLGPFLSGPATLTGNATVGGAGDLSLGGRLAGNFALTKVGAGTYIQSGGSYTGGTTVHEGTFAVFVDSSLGAATGAVTVDTAGKLSIRQTITTGRLITLTGGTLEILAGKTLQITNGQLVNNGVVRGTISINSGSVAKGAGTYDVVLINNGTFAPGNSPGIATANSLQFTTAGSTLAIELAGTNPGIEYDQLHVAGTLTLGGQLSVSLTGGFSPAAGNTFDILDFGTLAGTFNAVSLPGLAPGLTWNTSQLYINGTLSVTAVPEPISIALLLVATIFTTMLRGCRRQTTVAASPSG